MAQLAFFAADTLGLTLYQMDALLTGAETRVMPLGPWLVDLKQKATSDIITPRELSFWVIYGQLQLYLVVREKECYLMVLDAFKMAHVQSTPTLPSVEARLTELKPAVCATFHWDGVEWKKVTK